MTRDDVISMAREAGIGIGASPHKYTLTPYCPEDYLERFFHAAYAAGAAAEREACAKVCEEGLPYGMSQTIGPAICAFAIRARGDEA